MTQSTCETAVLTINFQQVTQILKCLRHAGVSSLSKA